MLDRIVRNAGYGWRDLERHLHEQGGPGERPPLGDLLRDLNVMDLDRDNFFEVLVPRFDKTRFEHPIEREVTDLLQELGAPKVPAEVAAVMGDSGGSLQVSADPTADPAVDRNLDSTLRRTLDQIDRRVLELVERTLGEPASPLELPRPKRQPEP